MISKEILRAFHGELQKQASMGKLTKTKAALLLGTGAGLGMVGEQAKDDLMAGRRTRQQQARAMNVSPMSL